MYLPNELLGEVDVCVEVASGIERKRRHNVSTVAIVAVGVDTAYGEEGPSRGVSRVGNAGGRGFEEIELVDRAAVHCAGKYGEELQ